MLPDSYPHPIRTEWKLLCTIRVDHPDITNEECAKQLGVNPNTIRLWSKNPLYQSYEDWFIRKNFEALPLSAKKNRAEMQEELDEFAQEMLGRLKDIAETSHDSKLIAQIGFDALDRAGYAAVKKESARPIQLILTPELVSMLKQRASEVVDGEVVVGSIADSQSGVAHSGVAHNRTLINDINISEASA